MTACLTQGGGKPRSYPKNHDAQSKVTVDRILVNSNSMVNKFVYVEFPGTTNNPSLYKGQGISQYIVNSCFKTFLLCIIYNNMFINQLDQINI